MTALSSKGCNLRFKLAFELYRSYSVRSCYEQKLVGPGPIESMGRQAVSPVP